MKKRAYRRWRYQLRKRYWLLRILREDSEFKSFWPDRYNYEENEEYREGVHFRACFNANTAAACSCYMCGNPRKHWGDITVQEKKSNISYREQLDEAMDELQRLRDQTAQSLA